MNKRNWIANALVASALVAGTAASQTGYGPGMMGPGMMGGYGPGMMGGYGPGMMGGYGPGMMGGCGPGMMGPGMMGGYGPGMMGGYAIPDLTADQRAKIQQAQQDFWKKQWPLMQQMHSTMWGTSEAGGAFDEQAGRKSYDAVAALHKQMFENGIELRKQMDAVLTPKQREQLRRDQAR